jgi:hypothetical protein
MTPPLETRHAPTLQDKSRFHPEESMVEDIVGKGVDPFTREVYLRPILWKHLGMRNILAVSINFLHLMK